MTSLDRSILVVGSGFSGLISELSPRRGPHSRRASLLTWLDHSPVLAAAKTLLDDGFVNVALVTSADRIGGIWASGSRYPGVLVRASSSNSVDRVLSRSRSDESHRQTSRMDCTSSRGRSCQPSTLRGTSIAFSVGRYPPFTLESAADMAA